MTKAPIKPPAAPGPDDAVGFLALLRRLERDNPGRPPIGRARRLRDEIVRLGQGVWLGFPDGDFTPADPDAPAPKPGAYADRRMRTMLPGYFGPQGPLPLTTTEEVARWVGARDISFVAFTDIFAERFLQLYFRAWSDAHAISQFDHPGSDRFHGYIAAVAGVGSPAFRDHDGLPDIARLPMVSLFGGRVRSAVRLRQMIETHLDVAVRVEEHVPLWLEFEDGDRCALGQQGSSIGQDLYLGGRVRSVNDKIRLHLRTRDRADYDRFLPGRPGYQRLADIVFWYLGKTQVVDIALSLPVSEIAPSALGGGAASLGWMAPLVGADRTAPDPGPDPDEIQMIEAARFDLESDMAPAAQRTA